MPQSVKTKKRRIRLEPDERESQILEGAVNYFAKNGFDGQMRELAQELGISQGLIYRYFPNKDALIDRVYQVVFLNRWNPEWNDIIRNRDLSLTDRLKRLYNSYYRAIDRYDLIRISLYSALKNERIGQAYLELIRQKIITPLIGEMRQSFGLPTPQQRPISLLEEQLVFSLHAQLIYALIRKHVYNLTIADQPEFIIGVLVDGFTAGLEQAVMAIHQREDEEAD